MKAIVLAAGLGTRLMPLTADRPKCLVALRGKKLFDYQRETFRKNGIDQLIVVTGYFAEAFRPYQVSTCFNPEFATTNMVRSLFCAEAELTGDIVISYGDIIYEERVLKTLLDTPGDVVVGVDKNWMNLWQVRMEDVLADAETMKVNAKDQILELGKKPKSLDEIQGQYMGLIKFSAKIMPEIRKLYHSLDPSALYDGKPPAKMFMTSFLQLVIDTLCPVQAAFIQGGWLEVDTGQDLALYEALEPKSALFDFSSFR